MHSAVLIFPAGAGFNSLIVSVQAIPPIVLLIPYMGLIVAMGLFNTYLHDTNISGDDAALLYPDDDGIFQHLVQGDGRSGYDDGRYRWKALWSVLVPVSIPGMVSVGMYTFMQAWNEYLFALTLTQTTNMHFFVPIGINLLMGQHAYDWSQMMAMSVLGSLPVLILFIFFQKNTSLPVCLPVV